MRILRDLAHSSRVLILLELRRKPASTLRPLADALSLTQQAVSGYVTKLEEEGLVTRVEGLLRVTPKGESFLEGEIGDLKAFVDRAARELVKLESCVAIAAEPVKRGEKVFLHMERGRLVARLDVASPSWGTALGPSAKGREVRVGELHGIVEIGPAALTVIEVPAPSEGETGAADLVWLQELSNDNPDALWAALDEVGEGALADLGREWHFEFAPAASAAAAVARGASPTYVGGPESVALLVAALEAAKAEGRLPRFSYSVVRGAQGHATSRTSAVPARRSRKV